MKTSDNPQNVNDFIADVPFFVKDIDGIRHLFPWQSRQPQWFKEYLLLIKTRRGNKHYVVKGLYFGCKFSVEGFSKFKVIGWRDCPKMEHNVKVLGEVALCVGFERWEAISPNTCYRLPFFRNDY